MRAEKEIHQGADSNFKTTVSTAFGLANKASDIFESSKTTKKRELIAFVFSNLSLRGAKLECTLRKPFDMMVNLHDRADWLLGGITRAKLELQVVYFSKTINWQEK